VGEGDDKARSLGKQRVSVSCVSRELSNVRDEAVGKRGVSCVSHSSWYVFKRFLRLWRVPVRDQRRFQAATLGCVASVMGECEQERLAGSSELPGVRYREPFIRAARKREDELARSAACARRGNGRAIEPRECTSEGEHVAQMLAPPLRPLQWKPKKKHESMDAGEIGAGQDWSSRCG
jgi:hypothetical protein